MVTPFVTLQAVLVFVVDPRVADMLQIEVRIPIRSMSVVFAGAFPLIEGPANPRWHLFPLFGFTLLLCLVFVPSPRPPLGGLQQGSFASQVGVPLDTEVLVG